MTVFLQNGQLVSLIFLKKSVNLKRAQREIMNSEELSDLCFQAKWIQLGYQLISINNLVKRFIKLFVAMGLYVKYHNVFVFS